MMGRKVLVEKVEEFTWDSVAGNLWFYYSKKTQSEEACLWTIEMLRTSLKDYGLLMF
jgi:hypothetical protein